MPTAPDNPVRIDRTRVDVLLVDDNPADVRLTQEVLLGLNPSIRLHLAADGVEALQFLLRKGPNATAPRPALVLLDLNMPRKDGRQLLGEMKARRSLRTTPTIVLSMSDAPGDVEMVYELQASAFVRKPLELDAFEDLLRSINDFWLVKAVLAPRVV